MNDLPAVKTRVRSIAITSWGEGTVIRIDTNRKHKPVVVVRDDGEFGYFHFDQIEPLTFPPDASCYGCLGTGTLQGFGTPAGRRCGCTLHEAGECEPTMCSPECNTRREARGE